ncbi:MAG: TVP38/TMEM64 family protein [Haloquadratum sp.]
MTAASLDRWRERLGSVRLFASPESRRRFVVHLVVAAALLTAGGIAVRPHLAFLTDAAALRAFIRGYGFWAPVVFVVLQAAQVVVAPVPGQILAVVAGYLFGVWWGTVYNMLGIAVGSTVAFWLSRRFGRAYVERIVHDDALARFDALGDDYARGTLFLLFLVPGLPDDTICFAGGLTRIPLWQLVAIAVVGRVPGFFLANVVGGLLGTDRIGAALALSAAVVVLSALGYLARGQIIGLFGRTD